MYDIVVIMYMGALLNLVRVVAKCAVSTKKYSPKIPNVFQPRGRRFLDGNVEYVIPAQRRIRIFGKRFMESEMGSILVKVAKMYLDRKFPADYQRKTCTKSTVTLRNS